MTDNDYTNETPKPDRQPNPKVVLVTGASSGIGEATARRLARDGNLVVLTGRRLDRLEATAKELARDGLRAEACELDVTDRPAFESVVSGLVARHGRLDVLVGNAGVMLLSRLDSLLTHEWDRMIDVNLKGLYNGIAAVLPVFESQESGHLVTVAPIGAHQVVPTSAIYSATKYAAWALTEGLRLEARPSIRVTTVSPGVVDSELADHITDSHAKQAMRTYRAVTISPDTIADAISFAMSQPADVDVNEIIVRPTGQR